MTNVVVGNAFDVAEAHRQHGLHAFKRLTLALRVHAQYQCVLGWAQVQADLHTTRGTRQTAQAAQAI
jgi:hypothetical protein